MVKYSNKVLHYSRQHKCVMAYIILHSNKYETDGEHTWLTGQVCSAEGFSWPMGVNNNRLNYPYVYSDPCDLLSYCYCFRILSLLETENSLLWLLKLFVTKPSWFPLINTTQLLYVSGFLPTALSLWGSQFGLSGVEETFTQWLLQPNSIQWHTVWPNHHSWGHTYPA